MKAGAKKLAWAALLTAAAMLLGYVERLLPLQAVVPVPGVKLGLANIATLLALETLGLPAAFLVVACRCLGGMLLGGNAFSLLYSLSAGCMALLAMAAARRLGGAGISLWGVSMAGAAAHNLTQVSVAALVVGQGALYLWLGPLLAVGCLTATATALAAGGALRRLPAAMRAQTIIHKKEENIHVE
ncbi:MAG: Gx transporter family protein [Eubacteriales bacterium]|nr:Gx transporter family protein [Eubacteriales bacterium]